nr:RNA-directed DNA polymerase, eukaryota [Tanacetum cinerariifolium]
EGEVVIMGDFNEVRDKRERFGSVFNRQGADNFNSFISSAGLVEVPLDDFDKLVEDSWKEAQIIESNAFLKMLKKLRYLKVKIQMWSRLNKMWSRLNKESSNIRKRKLNAELADLDMAIDKGDGEVIDVNRRHEVVRLLQDVEKIESLDMIWNERLTTRRLKGRCGIVELIKLLARMVSLSAFIVDIGIL